MEHTGQSRAEAFSRRSGTLISMEFVPVGEIKSVSISLVRYRDLISEQEEQALRFEYTHYDGYTDYTDTKIGVLDKDEFEGLFKSLTIIKDQVYLTNPANYTEVNFTSRSGFKAGCYYDKGDWRFYLKLSQFDENSNVFMKKQDLHTLMQLLSGVRTNLLSH